MESIKRAAIPHYNNMLYNNIVSISKYCLESFTNFEVEVYFWPEDIASVFDKELEKLGNFAECRTR